ncbi:hypothetical protein P692DRAFT_20511912 [Suillus brevipes Sb2]|nr:hypothetical protein P692DRAFT_20511912 [Suillus brevipes Sb2]
MHLNVRSSAELSYSDAQKAIDGHILGDLVVTLAHSTSLIVQDIKVLRMVSQSRFVLCASRMALSAYRRSVLNLPLTQPTNQWTVSRPRTLIHTLLIHTLQPTVD